MFFIQNRTEPWSYSDCRFIFFFPNHSRSAHLPSSSADCQFVVRCCSAKPEGFCDDLRSDDSSSRRVDHHLHLHYRPRIRVRVQLFRLRHLFFPPLCPQCRHYDAFSNLSTIYHRKRFITQHCSLRPLSATLTPSSHFSVQPLPHFFPSSQAFPVSLHTLHIDNIII
jgi:hypothetical protein